MEIVPAEPSEAVDARISELYLKGTDREEMSRLLDLSSGTIGARLGRMFKAGTLEPKPRAQPQVSYRCPRCKSKVKDTPGIELKCDRCGWRER